MRPLIAKIKPANGFSRFFHLGFNVFLPILVFALVRMSFVPLALVVILVSKWRMLAVRPRFWLVNIRANAVDIMVGVSFLLFIVHSGSQLLQAFWTLLYVVWLVYVKPGSTTLMTSVQAMIAMLVALLAVFIGWGGGPLLGLVLAVGLICYLSAHHFLDGFEEPYTKLLAYLWAYFGAALVWVLGHWLLFYGVVAQPALLLVAIGFGLATLYYLDHHEKLTKNIQRQCIFIMVAIIIVIITFSDWGDKIV